MKTQTNIPAGHQTVMPYLIIENVAEFINFTIDIFGAEEQAKYLREGTDEIMHAEIKIGTSLIMIGQANQQWGVSNAGLFIYVNNIDALYNDALAKGATSVYPPDDKDYGRSAGIIDPFGNTWWLTQV
jgi:PhnB protein